MTPPFRTYQLVIRVARTIEITVGHPGTFSFLKGTYVYTGSAKRNFEARIARHLREEKTLRWHIDCLLTALSVSVTEVRRTGTKECKLNQATEGEIVASGFGDSNRRRAGDIMTVIFLPISITILNLLY
jgi:Uri superfamily endonuclease